MANSRNQNLNGFEYATVDAAPAAGGYWTNPVSIRRGNKVQGDITNLYFSVRESVAEATSVITPILQFKCSGDAEWTDYRNEGTAFAIGDRVKIESNAASVQWRAGVHEGGRTSGGIILGLDW